MPLVADVYFAADSYAEAPDRECEAEEETSPDPLLEFAAELVRINGLPLVLKQLEVLLDPPFPDDWWAVAVNPQAQTQISQGLAPTKIVESGAIMRLTLQTM